MFGLALVLPARAQDGAPTEHRPAIWYRASQQCPSDAEFMTKLVGNAVQPKLAEAGDHIDFLVTLVDSGTETVGHLERQTRAGTVAIRELRDPSCARVAEGLALSLGLALEPGQTAPVQASGALAIARADDAVAAETAAIAAPAAPPPFVPVHAVVHGAPVAMTKRASAVGAAAGVLYGLSPRPMARGQAFVDLNPMWPQLGSKFSARLGVVGALGSAETRIGSVQSFVLGGFAEGCPWRVGEARLSLRPCLGFELGASGASHERGSGLSDSTVWATPAAGLRLSAALAAWVGLEAGAGIELPIVRSEVFAGPSSVYRAEMVLFQATLGFFIGLP